MAWKVSFSPRSTADLERITRYIAKDSPLAAERFFLRLVDAAERLAETPFIGHPAPFWPSARMIAEGPYLLIYRLREKRQEVEILRFWHSARGTRPRR